MSPLHLVHIPVDLARFNRWAGGRDRGWAEGRDGSGRRRIAFDEGRALHHLLCETFGKSTLQPFRLLASPGRSTANLYAYSPSDSAILMRTARECAAPDVLGAVDIEQLATKAMPQEWREGRRLGFDLRVRPVRRLLKPAGNFAKGAELDAFLVEALRCFPDRSPANENEAIRREDVYVGWLKERLHGGARIDHAPRLVRFARHRAARNGHAPEGPDAIIQGDLTIADPERFAALLKRGVGRHTAYGYGMLLLRPPGRG
jgi:CRISPR system Cascade subunit CasE